MAVAGVPLVAALLIKVAHKVGLVVQLFLARLFQLQTTAQFMDRKHDTDTARHPRRVLPKRH